ncbi:hypothetical protein ACJQWK_04268 [Exserohilum turcicum]
MDSGVQELITFTRKAANVCSYCRIRKQKCDRTLPRCNRCAGSNRNCDYTPHKAPQRVCDESDPLVSCHESCSQTDSSSRGMIKLLQRISACTNPFAPSELDTIRLWNTVQGILDLAGFDLSLALKEFGMCIHQWCPVLDENMLENGENDLSEQAERQPLFALCMWLLMQRPCIHQKSMSTTELYRTMKHIHVILQMDIEMRVEAIQVGMLIAAYEVSHGLRTQAHFTVSSCAIMLQILDCETSPVHIGKQSRMLKQLKSSLLRLDRVNHLMACPHYLQLVISPEHPIPTSLAKGLGPMPPTVRR